MNLPLGLSSTRPSPNLFPAVSPVAVPPTVISARSHWLAEHAKDTWANARAGQFLPGYALFILLTATLFVRPADILPELAEVPIYQYQMIATFVVSLPAIVRFFNDERVRNDPLTVCLFGMLVAVFMSHASHMFLWGARTFAFEFMKVIAYYILLVSHVRTPDRLRNFVAWFALFVAVAVVLPLAHNAGYISFPALEALEQREQAEQAPEGEFVFKRLRSVGIFNDPNDLAMILSVGVGACGFLIFRSSWFTKPVWLALVAVMLYGIIETRSRGGLIAIGAVFLAFGYFHWGKVAAVIVGILAVPAVIIGMSTRTDAFGSGTGQSRIQLWSDGLQLFKANPLFGIGYDLYAEEVGQVAHNSFVHCFTELGFFGGLMFLGMFLASMWGIVLIRRHKLEYPDLKELRVQISSTSAMVLGMAVAQLSLSRAYIVPTYLVLGIASAVYRINRPLIPEAEWLRANGRFAIYCVGASVLFLVLTYLAIRLLARF